MSLRSSSDNFSALAFPPLSPPLRPILDRYSEISDFSFGCSFSFDSSVESRTISRANWFGSFGSGLLDRLMHTYYVKIVGNVNAR